MFNNRSLDNYVEKTTFSSPLFHSENNFNRFIMHIFRIIIVIMFLWDVKLVKKIEMQKVYHYMGPEIAP